MRSYGSEYIRNGTAAAQALIRQAKEVRKRNPNWFRAGQSYEETRTDDKGKTVVVTVTPPPRAAALDGAEIMRRYRHGAA